MFRVALDLGGICFRGPLSLSVSQLPSGVANLMWWVFLCFTGPPLTVLLLYCARLPFTVLDLSVLCKGIETGPTRIQIGPACVQTMPRLPRACLWQTELF